jgi:thiamine biosynthesis lipoprotein
MGVEFEIVLFGPDEAAGKAAIEAAMSRIAELESHLSDYDLDSELSRLSAQAPTTSPIPLSGDLFTVLQASQTLAAESGGAFDVTVGPLTKLWRRARRQKEVPPAEMLRAARQAVGYRNLVIHDNKTAELTTKNMRLDLGGIAKGYAVDEALRVITARGIRRALVRASGDIAAADPPPDEPGWKVGLAPLNPHDEPQVFVSLKNQAISTSGESRQHLVIDGRRYSHLLDPRSGQPLQGRMSVTVLAPRSIDADSWASTVAVLGPTEGLRFLSQKNSTHVYMITADNDGRNEQTHVSPGFPVLK